MLPPLFESPGSLPLFGAAMLGMGLLLWRRPKAA